MAYLDDDDTMEAEKKWQTFDCYHLLICGCQQIVANCEDERSQSQAFFLRLFARSSTCHCVEGFVLLCCLAAVSWLLRPDFSLLLMYDRELVRPPTCD